MRKLKRAHQKYAREQTKRRKKFRQRAIAAGTVAAIALGTGVGINNALAAYTPDPHELAVSKDADADLLANKEELAIGWANWRILDDLEVDITLIQAKELSGIVVDQNGTPVADAEVSIPFLLAGSDRQKRVLTSKASQKLLMTKKPLFRLS